MGQTTPSLQKNKETSFVPNIEVQKTDPTNKADVNAIFSLKNTLPTQKHSKTHPTKTIPTADLQMARFSFIIFGTTASVSWSSLLNSIYSVLTTIYNSPSSADSVLFGYFFFSMLTGAFRIRTGSLSPTYFMVGNFCLFSSFIMFSLTASFISGLSGIILIYFCVSVTGIGISLVLSTAFSYGSIIGTNLTGFVMAGSGFAGLFGFLIWQFLTRLFFNIENASELKWAVNILFFLMLLISTLSHFLFLNIKKKDWLKISLDAYTQSCNSQDDSLKTSLITSQATSNLTSPTTGTRPIIVLFKKAHTALLMGNGSFFLTFFLFPNFGPYAWDGLSLTMISLLIGFHQIFDFIGRFLPNFGSKFRLKHTTLIILSIFRLLYLPIFVIFALFNNPVTTNIFLRSITITTFSFSHGYFSSLALSSVPSFVNTIGERGKIGLCINLHQQFLLSLAILLSSLSKMIFKI